MDTEVPVRQLSVPPAPAAIELEAKIAELRIAEREIQALEKLPAWKIRPAPGPKPKPKRKPERGVVTFNFLYTEQGRRVPDANKALEACFRAVIEAVRHKKIGRGTLVKLAANRWADESPPRLLPRALPASKGSSSSAIRFIPLVKQTSFVRSIAGYQSSDVVRPGFA